MPYNSWECYLFGADNQRLIMYTKKSEGLCLTLLTFNLGFSKKNKFVLETISGSRVFSFEGLRS
ncbi:hypothetical protein KY285_012366 [Solanum tuberosum]|nr:hypothetical protein KY289_011865 [Solanum tuberosum]KAH0736659.1 hypothetical protein KY285_012366 [Solanum tuberosum]